jgi:hypothetical protein
MQALKISRETQKNSIEHGSIIFTETPTIGNTGFFVITNHLRCLMVLHERWLLIGWEREEQLQGIRTLSRGTRVIEVDKKFISEPEL